jgi:hypothetical protein
MIRQRRNPIPSQQPPPRVRNPPAQETKSKDIFLNKNLTETKVAAQSIASPRSPQSPRILQPPLPPANILNNVPYEKVDKTLRCSLNIFDKNYKNEKVLELLENFVACNAAAATSPNLKINKADNLTGLQIMFARKEIIHHVDVSLCLMKIFKILLRKLSNRKAVTQRLVRDLVHIMENSVGSQKDLLATECANVCLNLCYETDNVELLVDSGGIIPLTLFLNTPNNLALQASAAGALQSICFQSYGRCAVRDASNCIKSLVQLMKSNDPTLQARTVGAIHNISSDTFSIHIIREAGAIDTLISHLQSPIKGVCGSAAGAIQNLSREVACRNIIRKNEKAVESLSDLLFGKDVEAVSCAVGALLNIIGPELGDESATNDKRNSFKKLLSDSVAMGSIWQTLWE